MNTTEFVAGQMALFAFREGERLATGSDSGKLAIAFILANRVKAGWQNGDWMKVLENVDKHSASEPAEMLTFKMPDLWSPSWRVLSQNCREIYEGRMKDDLTWTPTMQFKAVNADTHMAAPVNQSRPSFFYANLNMPMRQWFVDKIIKSSEHPRTVEIQPLVLFG